MFKLKNQKSILIISLLIFILIITSITIRFVLIKNANSSSTLKPSFTYEKDDYDVLTNSYDDFRNTYAYKPDILNEPKIHNLLNMSYPGSDSVIASVAKMKLDIQVSQQQYDNLSKNYPLIKTNSQIDWKVVMGGDITNKLKSEAFSTPDEVEKYFEKNYINFQFEKEDLGSNARGGIDTAKTDKQYKSYSELYSLKYNGLSVLNLGNKFIYSSNNNKFDWSNYDYNIENVPFAENTDKKISHLNNMSYSRFIDNLMNNKNRIYTYGYIGSTTYTNEYMYIQHMGLNSDSIVIVDNISIDYLYINENSTLVPLVRLDGYANGDYGKVKITFWNWFIELQNLSDTN